MRFEVHLLDLLPELFNSLVRRSRRTALLDIERETVCEALLNSIRWTVLRRADDPNTNPNDELLNTTDRFASPWMSRHEILNRIEHSSGLRRPLANLALFIIEARVDLAITASTSSDATSSGDASTPERDEIVVTSLGTIARGEATRSEEGLRQTREIYHQVFDFERLGKIRPTGGSTSRLDQIEQLLEASELIREPLPYRMVLLKDLAVTRREPLISYESFSPSAEIFLPPRSDRPNDRRHPRNA
jgi:hypothetical protein